MVRTCPSCGQNNRVRAAHLASNVRCGKCKTVLGAIAEPIDADASLFDEIVRDAKVPLLVDFWAEWCGPCKMAAPEVRKVAADVAGRALVLKVDTEQHPDVAARYNVQGIPNFVVIRNGRQVFQQAGLVPHTEMARWIDRALAD